MLISKDFFKALSRFFTGKDIKRQNKIKNTPEYLDGFLMENKDKLKKVIDDYNTACSELKNHKEKIETAKKTLEKFEKSAKFYYNNYKKTNNAEDLERSKEIFLYVKENKASLEELELQETGFQSKVDKLAKAKSIFQRKMSDARIQINNKKSRIKYIESMKNVSSSIEDINVTLEEDAMDNDEINIDYYKADLELDELNKEMTMHDSSFVAIDDEFAEFVGEVKDEKNEG
ncbi:MAG: hypothetical protein ACRDD8_15895 [Bacteroidales bacterium]